MFIGTKPTTDFAVGSLKGSLKKRFREAAEKHAGYDLMPPIHPVIREAVEEGELEVYNANSLDAVGVDRSRAHKAPVYIPEEPTLDLLEIIRTRLRISAE